MAFLYAESTAGLAGPGGSGCRQRAAPNESQLTWSGGRGGVCRCGDLRLDLVSTDDGGARARDPGTAAVAGGWRAGKLRARDASGRTVKKAESSGADELHELMAAKRAKVARLAAMRERVGAEMAEAMDTGVRVNVALAQALGVEVPERIRPEEGVVGSDDEMSSGASDESDSEGSAG